MTDDEYLLASGWIKQGHWWLDPNKNGQLFVFQRQYKYAALAIQRARDAAAKSLEVGGVVVRR